MLPVGFTLASTSRCASTEDRTSWIRSSNLVETLVNALLRVIFCIKWGMGKSGHPGLPIQSRTCLELIDINIRGTSSCRPTPLDPPLSVIQNAFRQARGCFTEVL